MLRRFTRHQNADFFFVESASNHNDRCVPLRHWIDPCLLDCRVHLIPAFFCLEKTLHTVDMTIHGVVESLCDFFLQLLPGQMGIQKRKGLKIRFSACDGLDIVCQPIAAVHQLFIVSFCQMIPVFCQDSLFRSIRAMNCLCRSLQMFHSSLHLH